MREPEELVPGALNFRDTGGLEADGGRTRPGVLFRSGNLAGVTAEGREAIRALRIRTVVDLRDDTEVAYEPTDLRGLEVVVDRVPLFAGSVASFFRADVTLDALYRTIVDDSGDALVRVARRVITDGPVLVHCSVGKDRTGVSVALVLAAAGVAEDEVIADYARTEAALPAERNAMVLAYLRRAHPEARNLETLAIRSPAPVMRGLLDHVRQRYGGAADYLRTHGVSEEELRALRRTLVIDD